MMALVTLVSVLNDGSQHSREIFKRGIYTQRQTNNTVDKKKCFYLQCAPPNMHIVEVCGTTDTDLLCHAI